MTDAPSNLLAVRKLLLAHLEPHGLAPAEVGIVGNAAHRGGYHCGRDRTVDRDYSVTESKRDSLGLTLDASALDVGTFSYGRNNLQTFSTWCVAQCVAGAADTRDIREIIYSPDGRTVKRWDRLGIRSTGDSSHLFHTHFSLFRDSTKARRDQTPLFRRYLESIGLIESEDVMATLDDVRRAVREALTEAQPFTSQGVARAHPEIKNGISLRTLVEYAWSGVAELSGRPMPDVDEAEVARLVLAGLPADKIAQAIPAGLASEVADELGRRIGTPSA